MGNYLIRGGRVIDPAAGLDRPLDLLIEAGRLKALAEPGALTPPPDFEFIDASGLVVTPGFIDLHAHLREPGQEHKETIATGTLAAARGGFTTVCAMPNTDPPIDTPERVAIIYGRARETGVVRVLPIACVSRGQAGRELADLVELAEAGAVGFSDDGRPVYDSRLMRRALEYGLLTGRPVIDHCEEPALAEGASANEGPVAGRLGLRGMPAAAEEVPVARNIALAELTGGWVHLAHLSTRGSVELVRAAKARGVRVTAEVCPHHLTLTDRWLLGAEGNAHPPVGTVPIPNDLPPYDPRTKVNPPLRAWSDCLALMAGLRDGTIDVIATDHAPHHWLDKACEYGQAAFGISGLETAFGLLMTLVHAGLLDLPTLIARLTAGPGRILEQAGFRVPYTFRPGEPVDLVVLDPEAAWVVRPEEFASLGKNTPLAGATLRGRVVLTIFDGEVVYDGRKRA
ncbi:MAG: dihydroorotase [Chloroflexota bacterium]